MKLTVTTYNDTIFNVEVSGDMELFNLKAICQAESGVPIDSMKLTCDGKLLNDDNKKISSYGIKDGDMIVLQRFNPGPSVPKIDFSSISLPSTSPRHDLQRNARALLNKLRSSPEDVAALRQRNIPLYEAIQANDLEKFTSILEQQQREELEMRSEQTQMLKGNQFDINIQNKIAEDIRLKNVEHNMENAIEFSPECFGVVVMLYIDVIVNGHHVKAFVDSGAQMTIMSSMCAKRCDLKRLIDTRWEGIAKGVGVQKIIGRVHLCQIQIGNHYLPCSLSILENQPMDMLLGLDMLKRHQCVIDLKRNCLHIGTTDSDTPFLPENEIPAGALETQITKSEHDLLGLSTEYLSSIGSPGQGPSGQSTAVAPPAPTGPAPNEADVQQLMSNGFSRQESVDELKRQNGNLNTALVVLLSKSFAAK